MIELLIICVVIVYLVSRVEKARAQKVPAINLKAPSAELAGPGAQRIAAPSAATAAKPPRRLVIGGTNPFPLNEASFFKGFGVPTAQLCDARCFTGSGTLEEFPETVASAIRYLHEEGTAMGADVMRLVHHSRKLESDEAVYFALTRMNSQSEDYTMFAFLARTP